MEINRKEALLLAKALYARNGEGDQERAEQLVLAGARFDEGDAVRWYESPIHPHNRGEVLEVIVAGWPEWNPRDAAAFGVMYIVEFPGPEGVGRETFPIRGNQLLEYDEPEGAEPKEDV